MIEIKSNSDRIKMRRAGQAVAEVLGVLKAAIKEGVVSRDLDELARVEILNRGGIPVFKGYHGYPSHLCVSVNHEVVHGIPGARRFKAGDLVSLDLGIEIEGFVGDSATSVWVGEPPNQKAAELAVVTEQALYKGIAAAVPGARLGDIGWAIQDYVEAHGFSIVREYVGHGIGRVMHEDPQVPNYGKPGHGMILRKGMALAIEPMVNLGAREVDVLDDGWTVVTRDRSLSAHYEHTIFIDDGGAEILTAKVG